jgi:hypothetical protein
MSDTNHVYHHYDEPLPEGHKNDWREFFEAIKRGERVEITERMYSDRMDILPPRRMKHVATLSDGTHKYVDFAMGEGSDHSTYFWSDGPIFGEHTRYFAQR